MPRHPAHGDFPVVGITAAVWRRIRPRWVGGEFVPGRGRSRPAPPDACLTTHHLMPITVVLPKAQSPRHSSRVGRASRSAPSGWCNAIRALGMPPSVRRELRVGREKLSRLMHEALVKLEQGPVPCVRVCHENGVWQVLTQPVGVADRDHLIVHAVHHKCRLANASQRREALAGKSLPLPKCGDLRARDVWP
jgi:hypothetical protein